MSKTKCILTHILIWTPCVTPFREFWKRPLKMNMILSQCGVCGCFCCFVREDLSFRKRRHQGFLKIMQNLLITVSISFAQTINVIGLLSNHPYRHRDFKYEIRLEGNTLSIFTGANSRRAILKDSSQLLSHTQLFSCHQLNGLCYRKNWANVIRKSGFIQFF